MWITNHRCFSNFRMQYQCGFDFRRTQTVTGNVQNVVHTTCNPVVTIFITASTVTSEVVAWIHSKIGFKETLVVAVNGTHHGRPWELDAQNTFGWAFFDFVAFFVQQYRLYAEEWSGCRTRFQRSGTWQWSQHVCAGFSLPPSVNDWAMVTANNTVIPFPSFWVDRFTYRTEQAQAAQFSAVNEIFTHTHQHTNSGWCGIEDGNIVLIAHIPETTSIRISWDTFEHQGGSAVSQWAINDVGVTCYPTYVSRTPVNFTIFVVEYGFVGHSCLQQVTAIAVQSTFWFTSRTGSVEDEQWIIRVHRFRFTNRISRFDCFVIPNVTAFSPFHWIATALNNYASVNAR